MPLAQTSALELNTLRALTNFSQQRVIEIGAGDGRLAWPFAPEAALWIALDPDAEEIGVAADDLRKKNIITSLKHPERSAARPSTSCGNPSASLRTPHAAQDAPRAVEGYDFHEAPNLSAVRLVIGDGRTLSFSANAFDLALFTWSLC